MNVPPAQLQVDDNNAEQKAKHLSVAEEVKQGVQKILEGHRAGLFSADNQKDLLTCCELMFGKDELQFDWDISLYQNAHLQPRVASRPPGKVGVLQGDIKAPDVEDEDDCYDLASRPSWQKHEVRVIELQMAPFWMLAR